MSGPEVSVVMSVYNGEPYLREAVFSILNQTFSDLEFIIVDDASRDNTWEILKGFEKRDRRILLMRNQENSGLSRSLNSALKMARGRFIARQDADDISMPSRIESQVSFLKAHPDVGIVGSIYNVIGSGGEDIALFRQPETDTEIRWQIIFHNPFCHSSVMFKKEILNGMKIFYREDLLCSQDYEFWTRILERTKGTNLQVPLVAFRVHKRSQSHIMRNEQGDIATEISAEMIKKVNPSISLSIPQVERLRQWYYQLPERWSKDDLRLAVKLIQILDAFGHKKDVDPKVARRIQRRWMDAILQAIPEGQVGSLLRSGLLLSSMIHDPEALIMHIPRRIGRRFRDLFGR